MAYKFQLGEAQLSGALVQEGAIKIHNESGTQVGIMKQDGTVSGSGELQGSAVDVDGAVDGKDGFKVNGTAIVDSARAVSNVTTIAMGGALSGVTTLAASGLASVASISMDDGSTLGPDSVAGLWTFSADGDTTQANGAYDFDLASHDGTNGLKLGGVLVNASAADLNFTNVATAGTVEASKAVVVDANKDADGFRNVSGSNLFEMGSISIGDTLTADETDGIISSGWNLSIENSSETEKFSVVASSGAVVSADSITAGTSFVIGSADLNEADMEKLDGITNGTAAASKAVVLDASKDITGINELTASYFKGDGSGITNINVENLDAAGSDTQVQFNNNGEFGGAAGFTFDGTGSVATSVLLSSADLKATNLVAGRLPLVSTAGLLDDNALFGYSTSRPAQLGNRAGLIVSSSASGSSYLMEGAFYAYDTNSELIWDVSSSGMRSRTSVTISGSDDGADDVGLEVTSKMDGGASITGIGHIGVGSGGNFDAMLFSTGVVSGSAAGKFESLQIDSTEVISSARAVSNVTTVGASGLASLDGGINVNDDFTVDTDGNVGGVAISGSGNFSIGGTLSADNLANATVDLTADLMVIDDGASGAIKVTSLSSYATALAAGANEGLASTAGRLELDLNDLTAAAVSVANDSIAIVDANDSNATRKESIADLVSAMAGAGLAASSGVLSTQAQSVHTDFNAGVAIEEGYNVYTGSANINVALPASAGLTAGDIYVIKQGAAGDVTLTANGSDLIDGAGSIVLESPYAAVSVLFTGVANTFRIV